MSIICILLVKKTFWTQKGGQYTILHSFHHTRRKQDKGSTAQTIGNFLEYFHISAPSTSTLGIISLKKPFLGPKGFRGLCYYLLILCVLHQTIAIIFNVHFLQILMNFFLFGFVPAVHNYENEIWVLWNPFSIVSFALVVMYSFSSLRTSNWLTFTSVFLYVLTSNMLK